jgi:RNA polymerase sigma-70 factor (ECF subfamily)
MKSNKDAYASDADRMVSEKTKELGAYIGTAQEQNDSFRITANVVNGTIDFNHSKLEKLNYIDWVPATAFIPETEATITKHGEEDLTTLTVNNKKALNTQAAAATFSPQSIIIQYMTA